MFNDDGLQGQAIAMNLPATVVAPAESVGLAKVLKFLTTSQISPHKYMIAQAFYSGVVTTEDNRLQQKQAICYHYGVGDTYLMNCLSKVKVFNTDCPCVDCGVLYEVSDLWDGIYPVSNVFRYAVVAGDTSGGIKYFDGLNGTNDCYETHGNTVAEVVTRQWRCSSCVYFFYHGNVAEEELLPW